MSKIGILTFHYSTNYGAVLQAFSLQETIKKMGHDVEIINFVPENNKMKRYLNEMGFSRNRKNIPAFFLSLFKSFLMAKYRNSLNNKFADFRNTHLMLSEKVNEKTIFNLVGKYDLIIAGSDQIWNPSQRKMPFYFLDFGNKFFGKKASYAADSTTSNIDENDLERMKRALNEFNFITVRNQHSGDFVKHAIGKEPEIVADPTMLHNFSFENSINKKESYILCYILGKEINGSNSEAIKKIKNENGEIPVYFIKNPSSSHINSDFADKVFYDLNPVEWVNMFKDATYVYTDSFHGVLFSLKYHIPFLAYYSEKLRATRFLDLGKRYGIENFIVNNIAEIEEKNSVKISPDFSKIDILLEQHRRYSIEILADFLNRENK
jgi:hypothetical protein